MSDSDAGGDDGFDKEAEREKLREKYERDRKRREATQQMSELLLKGATMTDHHCDDCGSPIFRYDGEEFCPTCAGTREMSEGDAGDAAGGQGDDDGTAAQGDDGAAAQGGAGEAGGHGGAGGRGDASGRGDVSGRGDAGGQDEAIGRGDAAHGPAGAGADAHRAGGQNARQGVEGSGQPGAHQGGQPAGHEGAAGPSAAGAAGGGDAVGSGAGAGDGELDDAELEAARARLDERVGSGSTGGRGTDRRREPTVGDSPVQQGEVPSMAQTRAALRRAIVSLSEQAAQSDDPPRAHELLKGAREASEALAALEGTTGE